VRRLVDDEGVDPDRITILGSHRRPIDEGKGQEIAGHRVGSLGDPGLVAETIHRFKGLEDDVVIVFLDEVENDRHRALAYVGMSRARALLIVVGSKEVRSAIGW
jgi:superfamily I DNA/RNA helicase